MKLNGLQQWQTRKQTQKQPATAPARQEFQLSFAQKDPLDDQLRKPRSRAYMEIFDAVDLISATDEEIIAKLLDNMDPDCAEEFAEMTTEELLEEIRATIQEEFRSAYLEIEMELHGVLARCYIDGCDCHAISAEGKFLDHYLADGPIPENLQKGRALFGKFPDCKCIEVYTNCCRVILRDSSVIKVHNNEM